MSGTRKRFRKGFDSADAIHLLALLLMLAVRPAWSMDNSLTSMTTNLGDGYEHAPEEIAARHAATSEARVIESAEDKAGAVNAEQTAQQQPVANRAASTAPLSGRWQLSPIRFWGDLVYDVRREAIEGRAPLVRNLATANINAATYIYEPWFATVVTGLGFTVNRLSDSEASGRDTFVTGYAKLNLFPYSRFPLEARYQRGDSRIDSGLGADTSYKSDRYGLTQRYRTADGATQYSASFDRYSQDSSTVGRDVQDALQFDMNTQFRRTQNLQLMGAWNHNRRINTGDETRYDTFVARHTYHPDATFSLENSANVTYTDSRFGQAASDFRFYQVNSIAFWRPQNMPLTLTESIRLFTLRSGNGDGSAQATAINGSVGANYILNKNTRLTGSVSLTETESGGRRTTTDTESLGAAYQGNTIELGKFRYDWFTSGTGIHSGGATEQNGLSFNGQFGHSINRAFALGTGKSIGATLTQTASLQTENPSGSTRQVVHTGSIVWNSFGQDTSSTSFIRLSGTDSRYLDGRRETFQLVNLQATRNQELGRDQSWSGNLTIQRARSNSSRQELADSAIGDGRFRTTASADVTYRYQNIFSVPRLTFFSQLKINHDEVVQVLGTPEQRESRSWENRLDYSLGRLESRFLVRVADIEGRRNWLVMLKLVRRFGN